MTELPREPRRRWLTLLALLVAAPTSGETPGPALAPYISVDAPVIALTGVSVFDGTGAEARRGQTIVVSGGIIRAVGPSAGVQVPEDAEILDLPGHTVIPGLVGTHNHLHMPGNTLLADTAPRLYLGSGVTTIQTTGSADPAGEAALARSIDRGEVPGPTVVHTGPYLSGEGGNSVMIRPKNAAEIETLVRTWVAEGVTWFKAYRHISPEHLRELIDTAHAHGAKVTGHLCSVTYAEAAGMGIDAIEHGFLHAHDFATGKEPGKCSGSRAFRDTLDLDDDSDAVRRLQRTMIEHGVALSSTLAIFEALTPRRSR